MTEREREQWSKLVGELLAPCPDQPVSLAQCVTQKRSCSACLPAATFLTNQVTRGKTRSQAEAAFRARFAPDEVKEVETGDSPSKGAKDPLVTIVEWADFECPFCGVAQPMLSQVVQRHPEKVRLVYKHYPLTMHPNAESAARASVAAGIQGKFWEMQSLFFQNQDKLDDPSLERFAKQLGLDVAQFNTDRKSEAVADRVASDRKEGDSLGLKGTPSIYINGRSFDLEKFDLAEDLEAWVELEIAMRAGGGNSSVAGAKAPATSATATHSEAQHLDKPVALEKQPKPPAIPPPPTAPKSLTTPAPPKAPVSPMSQQPASQPKSDQAAAASSNKGG
jgi:protein-disulfide isomerase